MRRRKTQNPANDCLVLFYLTSKNLQPQIKYGIKFVTEQQRAATYSCALKRNTAYEEEEEEKRATVQDNN